MPLNKICLNQKQVDYALRSHCEAVGNGTVTTILLCRKIARELMLSFAL